MDLSLKTGAKWPPTKQEYLRFYLALVDDYDALCEEFPVEQDTFSIPVKDPSHRWLRLVRAFALRKFVLQKGDVAHVENVLDVLIQLAAENGKTVDVAEYRAALLALINGGAAYGDPSNGNTMIQADTIIEERLYGGYLHGDYDKWRSAAAREGFIEENALWTWTGGAEHCVRSVARLIRQCEEDGYIPSLEARACPSRG